MSSDYSSDDEKQDIVEQKNLIPDEGGTEEFDESQVRGLVRILPYVWISTADVACDEEVVKNMKFTHIINCSEEDVDNFFDEDGSIQYTSFHIEDDHEADITEHFEEVYEVLVKVKEDKGRALVHCTDGKSVSPSIVVAYMMMASERQEKHLPLIKALDFVMSKEPYIQPNRNFMSQLIALEKDLYDEVSVRLTSDRRRGKPKHVRGKGRRGK